MLSKESSEVKSKARFSDVVYTLWGTFLLCLTVQISIPLEPVPITLGTFGVMLVALTMERKPAIQSILLYLTLGAMGAPVFANFRSGISVFLGTTGGYLVGYLLAIVTMSNLRKYLSNDNFFLMALNCLIGTVLIYVFGLLHLSHFVGFQQAIVVGFIPFILPGIFKILLLSLSVRYIKLGKIFN